MMDDNDLGDLTMNMDGHSALALTTLLNSGVEEALATLSPADLRQLEQDVENIHRAKGKAPRRKRESFVDDDEPRRSSGGQFQNLPASAPQVEMRDGIEHLRFSYSTKGTVRDYVIRVDIDGLDSADIPEDFRQENCVYPRAMCELSKYTGNRYEYETVCNDLAWRLTWLNSDELRGKRGLIQRAVDSMRNHFDRTRSRRVVRQEKLSSGTLRRRNTDTEEAHADHARGYPTLAFQWSSKGSPAKCKIRIDVENVNVADLDAEFKALNAVYPAANCSPQNYDGANWHHENACNELGWKLACLNAQKLGGKRALIQKSVEAFQQRLEEPRKRFKEADDNDFSEMVANTLQQALSRQDLSNLELDNDEMSRTMSTADLLRNLG